MFDSASAFVAVIELSKTHGPPFALAHVTCRQLLVSLLSCTPKLLTDRFMVVYFNSDITVKIIICSRWSPSDSDIW